MTGLGVRLTDLFISFAGRSISLRATTAKNTTRLTVFSQDGWLEVRESGNVDRGLPSELVICDKRGEHTTRMFAASPTVRANIEYLGGGRPGRGALPLQRG